MIRLPDRMHTLRSPGLRVERPCDERVRLYGSMNVAVNTDAARGGQGRIM